MSKRPELIPVSLERSRRLIMEEKPVHVHMQGSEWFGTRAGGLNRYFDSLFSALRNHRTAANFRVSASAFGNPPSGGSSWGTADAPLPLRYVRSRSGPAWTPDLVIDRHFSLYGGRPSGPERMAPLVVHFQGPWAGESRAAGERGFGVAVKRTFEEARYRKADAYVVLSGEFKDLLTNEYRVDADKVHVIPPGVDLEHFQPSMQRSLRPSVVCVRRLERRMGISVLLDAWKLVVAQCPEAHLTIVGTGGEGQNLRRQAQTLAITSSTTFAGRTSDEQLARVYTDSWVSVVPSLELEGFGLIALESLAAGRAPIVTDVGGLPASVKGLDETLVVEKGNVEALADRILSALNGDVPTPNACRAHAELFSWGATADRHLNVYRSVL